MALQYGTRVSRVDPRGGGLDTAGRAAGLLMVAGPAVAILAGLVLLPSYASLAQAEYELGCLRATVADAEAQVQANERLIAALPVDQVLTKRLAENQLPCRPQHEVIVPTPGGADRPPDLVQPQPRRRPDRPPRWVMTAARKMQNPPTRRGLLLLAIGALITAVYLFTPPQWPSRGGDSSRADV